MSPKPQPPLNPRQQTFHRTRQRLALWYTGVTTLILVTAGLIIYSLIAHARWLSLEKEMQTLAILIENQVEPVLSETGQLNQIAQQRLPELCLYLTGCRPLMQQANPSQLGNLLYLNQSSEVCVRLVDQADRPVAWLRLSPERPCQDPQLWERLQDSEGHYYHRLSYALHTPSQTDWGTLQILKSLNELDIYMLWIELALVGVISAAIVTAGFASWQLAKLAMQPVQSSYQQMEQFTADAAHELRSPLASLRAIVQTAMRSPSLTPQEIQETLQILNRQSQRLNSLVQDLLMFSQIGQALPQTAQQLCCLNQILPDLTDEFMAMAMAAQIKLTCQIQVAPLYVLGNPDQLHRAVANLISNGLNYTPAGGEVAIILEANAGYALIQVQDTGIGMAPQDQTRIFDRFYRVAQDRFYRSGGSGLGLAIAQSIVQTHQGSLTVQSQLGQGSRFTITLPLATAS
ncbi:MAG: two-component system sensor histidine kinase RppB [Elainella sp.]